MTASRDDLLSEIPLRILGLARASLMQANMHAGFMDPGNEHWPLMSVLNAAHAGELFIKAIIATEHPLLIFKDVRGLDDSGSAILIFKHCLSEGEPTTSTSCLRYSGLLPGFVFLTQVVMKGCGNTGMQCNTSARRKAMTHRTSRWNSSTI